MGDNYDIYYDDDGDSWYATVYIEQESPEEIGPFENKDEAEKAVIRYLQHQ